jgi:hypothetical protein
MEYGRDNDVKYIRADETQKVMAVCRKRNNFIKEKYQMT